VSESGVSIMLVSSLYSALLPTSYRGVRSSGLSGDFGHSQYICTFMLCKASLALAKFKFLLVTVNCMTQSCDPNMVAPLKGATLSM